MKRAMTVASVILLAAVPLFAGQPESEWGIPIGMGFDPLRNTSRLTNEELREGFEWFEEAAMAEILDLDGDGLADFTNVPTWEFLERMKIILSDQKPFEYKTQCWEPRSHRPAKCVEL